MLPFVTTPLEYNYECLMADPRIRAESKAAVAAYGALAAGAFLNSLPRKPELKLDAVRVRGVLEISFTDSEGCRAQALMGTQTTQGSSRRLHQNAAVLIEKGKQLYIEEARRRAGGLSFTHLPSHCKAV